MNTIDEEVLHLTEAIKASGEYRAYVDRRELLKSDPALWERTLQFRMRAFALQGYREANPGMADEIEEEFADILRVPAVSAFLDAERTFCRMFQKMNLTIVDAISFE